MSYTPYVDFEQEPGYKGYHIVRVGCMRCNDTIASKDPVTLSLYFWDHKQDVRVVLTDGSVAFVPVCAPCRGVITDADLPLFEATLKYGWMVESIFQIGGAKAVLAFTHALDKLLEKATEPDFNQAATDAVVKHAVPYKYRDIAILRRA